MKTPHLDIAQAPEGVFVVCAVSPGAERGAHDTPAGSERITDCPSRTAKTPWQADNKNTGANGFSTAIDKVLGSVASSANPNMAGKRNSYSSGLSSSKLLLTLRFPFDVSRLQQEHRQQLGTFARDVWPTLQGNALLVVGYTDDIGPERYNRILARERADSVATALRDLGIDSVRIEAKGKCCYVADNETPHGRAQNRRAEIHIVFNQNVKEPSQ